jgi:hypothetical protein
MPAMGGDTYVIRIYRQTSGDPPQPVGMVEQIRGGKKTPFHTMEELWRILTRSRSRKSVASGLAPRGKEKAMTASTPVATRAGQK